MNKDSLTTLRIAGIFLFLAVAAGAFGAHGLEKIVSEKALKTFQTGVTYQFYHAFALLVLGLIQDRIRISYRLNLTRWIFTAGVILFSFNCYLYAITGIKTFAMIVPVGGTLFLAGWFHFLFRLGKD